MKQREHACEANAAVHHKQGGRWQGSPSYQSFFCFTPLTVGGFLGVWFMNTKKNPLHTVSLRLDATELAALHARAKSSGQSLGAVAKTALLAHLIESSQLDRLELFSTQVAASASEAMRASARSVEDDTRAVIEQLSAIAVQQTGALDVLMARLDALLASHPQTSAPSRPAPPSSRWTPGKGVPD